MSSMTTCNYDEAWRGKCKNACPCSLHADKVCVSCKAPAVRSCEETGQFVCGAPLCEECEHSIAPDGTNGGVGFYSTVPEEVRKTWKSHVRKGEQQYRPWWDKKEENT
jgi:hypothetical protein